MKRIATFLLLLLCMATAQAQDVNYSFLVLRQLDTTVQTVPTDRLVITFADGRLTATNGTTTATVALSNLDAMYFSQDDVSGLDGQQESPVTMRVNGRMLQVSAPAGSQVLIASVGGMLIDHYTAGNDSQGTALRPGIYVVKVNGKSSKIYIK